MADHGSFYWNELAIRDPDAAIAFYGNIIGWTVRDMPMGEGEPYRILVGGGTDRGGMFKMQIPDFEGAPSAWMSYIAVNDDDAAAAKVESAGGKLVRSPFTVPGIGRIAILADPEGAVIGIMTPLAD